MTARERFPIRFTGWKGALLRSVLVPQRWSYVDIDGDVVRARMAWAFSTKFRRTNIASVALDKPVWLTAGVHGWRGRWLVNGAGKPIVAVRLHEAARAWVCGFPVRLRELHVSIEAADEFIAALH
jgi:hypothetical protein